MIWKDIKYINVQKTIEYHYYNVSRETLYVSQYEMTSASTDGGLEFCLSGGCQSHWDIRSTRMRRDSVCKMSADADPNPAPSLASKTWITIAERGKNFRWRQLTQINILHHVLWARIDRETIIIIIIIIIMSKYEKIIAFLENENETNISDRY